MSFINVQCAIEVFQMDTTAANIFAVLKPGNIIIHFKLPCGVELSSTGLAVVWIL